jgi:N-acetylglucosamine malate deacetylase 2
MELFRKALDCYETYQQVIEESNVKELATSNVAFEIFGESFDKKLAFLAEGLKKPEH